MSPHQDKADDSAAHQQERSGDYDQPPRHHECQGHQERCDHLDEEQRPERLHVPVGDVPEMQVDQAGRDE
jgi:hypothetical protein